MYPVISVNLDCPVTIWIAHPCYHPSHIIDPDFMDWVGHFGSFGHGDMMPLWCPSGMARAGLTTVQGPGARSSQVAERAVKLRDVVDVGALAQFVGNWLEVSTTKRRPELSWFYATKDLGNLFKQATKLQSGWWFGTSVFPLGIIIPTDFHTVHNLVSSTAQGGGGSFKNRKPIGEVGCCESGMAERSHWWTERWLRSPLFLSLSLTTYLPIYLSIYLFIYRSISLSLI